MGPLPSSSGTSTKGIVIQQGRGRPNMRPISLHIPTPKTACGSKWFLLARSPCEAILSAIPRFAPFAPFLRSPSGALRGYFWRPSLIGIQSAQTEKRRERERERRLLLSVSCLMSPIQKQRDRIQISGQMTLRERRRTKDNRWNKWPPPTSAQTLLSYPAAF